MTEEMRDITIIEIRRNINQFKKYVADFDKNIQYGFRPIIDNVDNMVEQFMKYFPIKNHKILNFDKYDCIDLLYCITMYLLCMERYETKCIKYGMRHDEIMLFENYHIILLNQTMDLFIWYFESKLSKDINYKSYMKNVYCKFTKLVKTFVKRYRYSEYNDTLEWNKMISKVKLLQSIKI